VQLAAGHFISKSYHGAVQRGDTPAGEMGMARSILILIT
jgi:hypothetical protein